MFDEVDKSAKSRLMPFRCGLLHPCFLTPLRHFTSNIFNHSWMLGMLNQSSSFCIYFNLSKNNIQPLKTCLFSCLFIYLFKKNQIRIRTHNSVFLGTLSVVGIKEMKLSHYFCFFERYIYHKLISLQFTALGTLSELLNSVNMWVWGGHTDGRESGSSDKGTKTLVL